MKRKYLYLLSIVLLFQVKCADRKPPGGNDNILTIDISSQENFIQSLDFHKRIDTVNYIILDPDNNNALIGKIDKIDFYAGKIFILDRSVTRSLFIFDHQGKYLHKINQIGRGPGEFENPFDFTIDVSRNELLVYCKSLRKINFYSLQGAYLRDLKLEIDFRSLQYIYPDKIAFFTHNIYNYSKSYGQLPYDLLIYTTSGKLVAKQFKNNTKLNEGKTVITFNQYFTRFGDTILINWLFNDTIYLLEDKLKATPAYLVDFGIHTIRPDEFQNDAQIFKNLIEGNGKYWSIYSPLFLAGDHLLFRIIAGKLTRDLENTYMAIYDFKRKHLTVFKNIPLGNKDMFFNLPITAHNEYFVGVIYPQELFMAHTEDVDSIKLPDRPIWIKRYDNPFLQLTRFK